MKKMKKRTKAVGKKKTKKRVIARGRKPVRARPRKAVAMTPIFPSPPPGARMGISDLAGTSYLGEAPAVEPAAPPGSPLGSLPTAPDPVPPETRERPADMADAAIGDAPNEQEESDA